MFCGTYLPHVKNEDIDKVLSIIAAQNEINEAAKLAGVDAGVKPTTTVATPLPPLAGLPESSVKVMIDADRLQFGR